MCLAITVVASWSLTQEVAGWQVQAHLQIYKYFCHWIQWKHLGKTQMTLSSFVGVPHSIIFWSKAANNILNSAK